MRSVLLIILMILGGTVGFGQIVFSEEFDEIDGAITGSDDGVTWSANCYSCGGGGLTEFFKVVGDELVAQNTHTTWPVIESAVWSTTSEIDISTCTGGFYISFILEQIGVMEGCGDCGIAPASGATCVDWVKLEYNLDGGGWVEIVGTSCPLIMTEAPGQMIQIGNIPGDSTLYISECIESGTDLDLRISVMNWDLDESWVFDSIVVACTGCVLPIEMKSFDINKLNHEIQLNWETASERNNNYFEIERSYNGYNFERIGTVDGAGNSTSVRKYKFIDSDYHGTNNIAYYRLKQVDNNGEFTYSEVISQNLGTHKIYYHANELHIDGVDVPAETGLRYTIYNLAGKIVRQGNINSSELIGWQLNGYFILEIPELGLREKFVAY